MIYNKEKIEGNEILAKFHGGVSRPYVLRDITEDRSFGGGEVPLGQNWKYKGIDLPLNPLNGKHTRTIHSHYLPYSSSWDWLMIIVKKIKSLESKSQMTSNYREHVLTSLQSVDINRVFNSCVRFINSYNKDESRVKGK